MENIQIASCTCVGQHDGTCALACLMCAPYGRPGFVQNAGQWVECWQCNQQAGSTCQHGVAFTEACHSGDCFRDGQPADKAVLVHSFIERHLKGGADNYAVALLLEKAGYTFRDLSDALIASRGM